MLAFSKQSHTYSSDDIRAHRVLGDQKQLQGEGDLDEASIAQLITAGYSIVVFQPRLLTNVALRAGQSITTCRARPTYPTRVCI